MNELMAELERLSQISGVELPPELKPPEPGKPAGRMQADPAMRRELTLSRLPGFLTAVNDALQKRAKGRRQ